MAQGTSNRGASDIHLGPSSLGEQPQFEESSGRAQYALEYFLYLASNWIAYDSIVNFPDAEALLKQRIKPQTISKWQEILYGHGPIIITGVLGAASVEHVILLVGVDLKPQGCSITSIRWPETS